MASLNTFLNKIFGSSNDRNLKKFKKRLEEINSLEHVYEKLSDQELVKITKFFTLFWGLIAIGIACVAYLADNLIQLVNIIGSIFYGNVLGIFLIAFFLKYIKSNAIFFPIDGLG